MARNLLVVLVLASGCSLNRFAADQAGGIAAQTSGYMRGFWDLDIARHGTAAAIMQLEAMHAVSRDNEDLSLTLVSTYVGYGIGFVEYDMQEARQAGRFAQSDRLRARAELIYRRARDLSLATMRHHDAGVDKVLLDQPASVTSYLNEHYADKADVGPVFWTAMSWGSMINMTDQMDSATDLPTIRAMVEHVARLNPTFEGAAPLIFLGGLYCQTPPDFGGDPAKGKAIFERALELTKRRAHSVQLNYAKSCALTAGDTKLYHALLDEILAPEDRGGDVRLANKFARLQAELLLKSQSPTP